MKNKKYIFASLVATVYFVSCGGKTSSVTPQESAGTTYFNIESEKRTTYSTNKYINKNWKCNKEDYVMYLNVEEETHKLDICKRECRQGNMHACANLSYLYRQELSIHANFEKAKELAEKSCRSGVGFGCYNLGVIYEEGLGVRRNYRKAAEYYRKACDMGHSASCNQLAELYLRGKGVEKNIRKAVELMRKACKMGDEFACFNLKDYIRKR